MTERLSIALTADPELPVPPRLYGGIERIVDLLARGLAARGHKVTLFAHRDSASPGRLVPWPGGASRARIDTLRNAATLAAHVWRERFDVVHSFSRLAYLAPILPVGIPKIMSYQREISPRTTRLAYAASRGSLQFTAISRWMAESVKHIGQWRIIPNGIELGTYTFQPKVAANAPWRFRYGETCVPATSVPFFDERCGATFAALPQFNEAIGRFLDSRHLCRFDPRAYILETLTLDRCARNYIDLLQCAHA